MKTNHSLALALVLGGCASAGVEQTSLRISGLTQGLARVESQDKGHIYSQGTTFPIATNGQCVAAGSTVPCMWFAIAFDYEATSEMTSLTCTTKFSEPIDVVDPTKTVGKDLREVSGPIALKGKTGKAFWPGYVLTDEKPGPVRSTTVCSFEGKEVLRADFVFEQK